MTTTHEFPLQIDFPEFALIMIPTAPERIMKLRRNYASKAAVEAAFKQFDTNHDGAIDFNEMKRGLQGRKLMTSARVRI